METSCRVALSKLSDYERLITALGLSTDFMPCSLRIAEGADWLAEELVRETRSGDVFRLEHATTPGGMIGLFRMLWNRPLDMPRPRSLKLQVKLASDPLQVVSLRVDLPTLSATRCWAEAEGGCTGPDIRIIEAVHCVAQMAGLTFERV